MYDGGGEIHGYCFGAELAEVKSGLSKVFSAIFSLRQGGTGKEVQDNKNRKKETDWLAGCRCTTKYSAGGD